MPQSTAMVATAQASKYLQQLCKHFAHRIEVEFDPRHGECRFSIGTAVLAADDDGLSIVVKAADAEKMLQTQGVVESHLLRFAFREDLGPLAWKDLHA